MAPLTDTIFAVASGAGRAAVTVLRISGPGSGGVLDRLCRNRPAPRRASLRALRGADGAVLDRALVFWLPGPGSYSGEDSAELHLHGGRAVLAGVAEALLHLGARPAEAGEFTRRAFLNGRMDLIEAEAVADLVAAETGAQAAQALRQMAGELGGLYRGWSERLVRLLAGMEALIDFPDEDLPPETEAVTRAEILALADEIVRHLDDRRRGELVREGLVCAVVGPPNSGKSTLINGLARRDVAIVSPLPGTTRDVIEVRMELAGVPVTLLDTAGLRDSADPIEAEGVRRAMARAEAADIVLMLQDASGPVGELELTTTGLVIAVASRFDLAGWQRQDSLPDGWIGVSASTGAGMDALQQALEAAVRRLTAASGPPPLTRARHRSGLTEAAARLRSAARTEVAELRAEDTRLALRSLGQVVGLTGVEEVLDSIFNQFCIGK